MNFLQSHEILELTSNMIHEDTQLHDRHLDLTVAEVHRLTETGSLDFGGSEFTPADTNPMELEKRNPDDKYGWWNLKNDTYKAALNESIEVPDTIIAVITPHSHAEKTGMCINTMFITPEDNLDGLNIYFHVPVAGCKIKENARVATVRFFVK